MAQKVLCRVGVSLPQPTFCHPGLRAGEGGMGSGRLTERPQARTMATAAPTTGTMMRLLQRGKAFSS
eukprot:12338908-Karenia_brevis.AAC.1